MDTKKQTPIPNECPVGFVKSFRHWRSGKILRAEDYGIKAFPIGRRKSKRKK